MPEDCRKILLEIKLGVVVKTDIDIVLEGNIYMQTKSGSVKLLLDRQSFQQRL